MKTQIIIPSRGHKKELVEMAFKNAKESFDRKRSTDARVPLLAGKAL